MMFGIFLFAAASAALSPGQDRDTRAWWATTRALSDDAMRGRDTGSADYERAAKLVADRFARAGLRPAGEGGSWFQRVPMAEINITSAHFAVGGRPLRFLHDVTLTPTEATPSVIDAPLAYRGYCAADTLGSVRGKMVICHGTHRAGLPSDAVRTAALRAAGAAGVITVADPGFTVEPPRWPFAYARSVRLATSPADRDALLRLTLNASALESVLRGSGRNAAALIEAGSGGAALPSFDLRDRLHSTLKIERRMISSPNVLGYLPGADPRKIGQTIVLSAHLDGYGRGEPVDGDSIYNGTLDDAAYVALLIQLADRRHGHGFARPVLFAAFTGEEKGLLGSRWYVAHPTLPKASLAADINLDQLRPIFPLDLLTVHALDDTTLGDDVRAVAKPLHIAIQQDPEPERNLLRRADHWPFLQAGIPATAFVFGYRPGTESERAYRHWYQTGYHRPQDDLKQPIDWQAATDFNRFFYALVTRVADKRTAPAWKVAPSPYASPRAP